MYVELSYDAKLKKPYNKIKSRKFNAFITPAVAWWRIAYFSVIDPITYDKTVSLSCVDAF